MGIHRMTPEAVALAYESAVDRMPGVSLAEFASALDGFGAHPIVRGGQVVAVLMVRGPEIHACVRAAARGRWMNKAALSVLNAVIEKHGYAQTTATTEAGTRFVKSLGFERHGDSYRSTKKWALKQS